jgi:hypothetical protein
MGSQVGVDPDYVPPPRFSTEGGSAEGQPAGAEGAQPGTAGASSSGTTDAGTASAPGGTATTPTGAAAAPPAPGAVAAGGTAATGAAGSAGEQKRAPVVYARKVSFFVVVQSGHMRIRWGWAWQLFY